MLNLDGLWLKEIKKYLVAVIVSPFDIDQCNATDVFTRIADNMLANGERNWRRLVVVFVIAAHISKEIIGDNQCQALNFTKEVGDYVTTRFSSSENSVEKAVIVFGLCTHIVCNSRICAHKPNTQSVRVGTLGKDG